MLISKIYFFIFFWNKKRELAKRTTKGIKKVSKKKKKEVEHHWNSKLEDSKVWIAKDQNKNNRYCIINKKTFTHRFRQ